ncbi:ribbon-helix-helix protein, CopG family [Ralstonia mannitolilytica]|uniref:ribbon-helix-helix protein, CopG family n=1 Tax=Ralstonia mannitolilytica TaxID=105219 RepID=UPI001C96F441|nr:ribbon-helix-helix protein, CopG family [Ralstonia mannitolilytica]MBY4717549.1 ribbon-helix-helix protein, CopG family [Ralstonia mannitolilytica]
MKNQWKEDRIIMQLHFYHEDKILKEQIRELSERLGISQMEVIRRAVREFIARNNKTNKQ